MRFALIGFLLLIAIDVVLAATVILFAFAECVGECQVAVGWAITGVATGLLLLSSWATWRISKRLRHFR